MKKILTILFFVLFFMPINKISFAQEYDSQYTLLALNYAIMSIYRVEKYPSRVTVDEEYNGIINNLAIGNISDDLELKNLFKAMMDAYTEDKLTDKDKKLIQRQYETQVNTAFLKVKPLSHIRTEVAFNTVKAIGNAFSENFTFKNAAIALLNPAAGLMKALLPVVGAGGNGIGEYFLAVQANERMAMQAQCEENEYMQQRMTNEWILDKEKIRRFNNLKTSLLDAEWTLLRKYNIPDEARLTEETIKQFYAFISDKDVERALRSAKRLADSFAYYPPFWFYYGKVAIEQGDIELAKSCFNKFFEQSRPILRKDQFVAATARYKIFTLQNIEQDQAKKLLNLIEKNSLEEDWNNFLFCALQWYILGEKAKTDELLLRNIDYNYDVDLHKELRQQLHSGNIQLERIKSVAIRQFTELSELEKLATSGNSDAQFQLGETLYRNGMKNQAMIWLQKARNQDHILAILRMIESNWLDHKIDFVKTLSAFGKLMNLSKEDKNVMILIADFYASGCGTNLDYNNALNIYNKLANENDAYAMFKMAEIYYKTNDKTNGLIWIKKSAEQGNALGQMFLGNIFSDGIGVEKDLNLAFYWYKKAAEQGNPVSQSIIGYFYLVGIGIQKDENKAVEWFIKSAEQGDDNGLLFLGKCYDQGIGVQRDLKKTFDCYQKSANMGNNVALNNLALMYYKGKFVQKDQSKAFLLMKKSAEQGYDRAQINLSDFYLEGIGCNQDLNQAFFWSNKATTQGSSESQLRMYYFYMKGIGVKVDKNEAISWLKKAASNGNDEAIKILKNN